MSEQTTPSKKISVGLILSWIFGVLFALTGIVSVFSEPIPGLVMLVMAAVLLPPVAKLVDQKWKFHLSGGMKIVVIIIGLIIFGATIDTSNISTTQQAEPQKEEQQTTQNEDVVNETTTTEQVDEEQPQAAAEHTVITKTAQGTARTMHVIVQTSISKDEIIAINDDLIDTYSKGLTHLYIEYFDDETIANDYFQKISQVSEAEGDELFKHYIGTYKMNKTSGLNALNFNENNNWITIKEY
jgi:hypothetical protein